MGGCIMAPLVLFALGGVLVISLLSSSTALAAGTACGTGPSAMPSYTSASMAYTAGFRGADLVTAVAIAGAESSWDPAAPDFTNTNGTINRGEWQINSALAAGPPPVFGGSTLGLFDWISLKDAQYNAQSAFTIYANAGNKFTAWTTYTNGTYLKPAYFPTATLAVGILTAVQAGQPPASACPPPPPPALANLGPINCRSGPQLIGSGWGLGSYGDFSIPGWATAYVAAAKPQLAPRYYPSWFHSGIDLECGAGTPVVAINAGTITFFNPHFVFGGGQCGGAMRINFGSYSAFYDHMQSPFPHTSGAVNRGDVIGYVAGLAYIGPNGWPCWAGSHLHFMKNGGLGTGDSPCTILPANYVWDMVPPSPATAQFPVPCWNPAGYANGHYLW
jgi:murein DD-endopeptidase MepM/ murein hydrolase activator NlpD